ncbi:hypothetical protein HW555_013734 [Spodoptera exigua]|uniref:Uncharacterized protein n=1 Tax=Spodoptera exigua TaxID=7107 RepID=A0A835KWP6_SPOEX|nr:hypothetical protein HW555_013734 [Spodoptera exigua]
MGKDEKEDSGFGFKDKAKAVETLRLLEQHDPNYRRLTVRGLLGRAKRVLSMTKAEDKIKNIKEAMESSSASDVEMEDKKQKEKKELPSESVPGLGFKDKEAAEGTLKELEGRDPDYQRLAVKGLIGRAKRVLTCTRDETKIANIKEAMAIFEKFLDDFESLHLSKQNNPYVSLGHVRTAEKLAGDTVTELQKSFISAYSSVSGEYKRLRTVRAPGDDSTWDIVRNTHLKLIKEKHADAKLFTEKDEPTAEHLEMLLWAYSPDPARVKKYLPETKEERKRRISRRCRRKSVPGLGFKNVAVAERSLRALRGRDPSYQKMVVNALMSNARCVLRSMAVFERFIEEFDSRRLGKQNNPYLSLETVKKVVELAGDNIPEQQRSFIAAYSSVRGEYQRLRNVRVEEEDTTWDIVRHRELQKLKRKDLFDDDGQFTEEHIEMLLWAYTPDRRRVWEYFYEPRMHEEREIEIDVNACMSSDEEDGIKKISKLKEAMTTVESTLLDLKEQNLSKEYPYLSLNLVKKAEELAGDSVTELQKSFISAYSSVSGEYKRLRTVRAPGDDSTWDIVRNTHLKLIKEKLGGAKLFTDDDDPTPEHIEMLLWAYSPEPKRVAKEFNFFENKDTPEEQSERDRISEGQDKSDTSDKNVNSDEIGSKRPSGDRDGEGGSTPRRSKRIKK